MSYAMQEAEPMKFKRDYGPRPDPEFNRNLGARVRSLKGRELRQKASPLTRAQRKAIGSAEGRLVDIAERFGVSFATVSRCRKELQESTVGADSTASRPSGVVAGGTPNDEPRAGVETGPGIQTHLL